MIPPEENIDRQKSDPRLIRDTRPYRSCPEQTPTRAGIGPSHNERRFSGREQRYVSFVVREPSYWVVKLQILFYYLRGSLIIDPIQKFNKPLTIDPEQDFIVFWIILGKSLVGVSDVYPNLAVDYFGLIHCYFIHIYHIYGK